MEEDMRELKRLKKRIETARKKLYALIDAKQKALTDREVVETSQLLDDLLVEYEEMLKTLPNMPNNINNVFFYGEENEKR